MDPNSPDPNNPIAKTQTTYDDFSFAMSDSLSGNAASTWVDPLSDATIPANSRTKRGRPTTARVWNKDDNSWIETRTQYDQYGNVRKVFEPNELIASSRFAETDYSDTYNCAYPTKVITPPPDPTDTYGTNQGTFATTTYDEETGLSLTATNELGQTTQTEYNDFFLRPTRTSGVGSFVIPATETEYGDLPGNIFVKVRKQIDAANWDEAKTFTDNLGRTFKTQAKDSQGDVFVETKYDDLGRVKWTSNPYRIGDTKYWSRPRYDELGRVFESCAPVKDNAQYPLNFNENAECSSGTSLGMTSWSISTESNFVGTVVTSTDASGRKSRSITNALGQLLRVDEATGISQNAETDLGSLSQPNQPTYYYYSPQGKMVKVKQGKDGDQYIQYRYFLYDSLGRLIRVRQPEQEVNSALDLTDPISSNNQWTAAFEYDLLGNVKRATDANGTNIINEYDKADRLTKKCYTVQNIATSALNCSEVTGNLDPDTPAVEYFYDGKGLANSAAPRAGIVDPAFAKGKLTKVISSVSETRYTQFDYLGRLLQMEQRTPMGEQTIANAPPHVSSYEYNFAGALVKETYPSGRVVQNEYEADGDLARIYGKAGTNNPNALERTYANAFSYTPDGRIEKLRLGNNRWEWAKFNNRLQVTELALGKGVTDASLWSLKYDYGEFENGAVNAEKNTGNIARQTINFAGLPQPLVQTYKYDSLYRLKEARETAGNGSNAPQTWMETFDYDRFGNREAANHSKYTGIDPVILNYISNPTINRSNNRFNENQDNDPNKEFDYDRNGNLIQDAEGRVFVFNGDNKQRLVAADGINVGQYFYDGEGKRVKKIIYDGNGDPMEETVFVYSGSKLVAEFSTKPVAQNPTTSYTATDQLGSPRVKV